MLQVFEGDNLYRIDQAIAKLSEKYNLRPQIVYADEADFRLLDLIQAQDLFATQKIVVIKNLFKDKKLIEVISQNLDDIIDDQSLILVLVEEKVDKRSKLAKSLAQQKLLTSYYLLKDYDQSGAVKDIMEMAKARSLQIDREAANLLRQLIGNNPLAQDKTLEKLAILGDKITVEMVKQYVAPSLRIDSFVVLDKVFDGETKEVADYVDKMERVHIVPQLFWGLVGSQITNLAIIKACDQLSPTRDFNLHPYVAQKITRASQKLSRDDVSEVLKIATEADYKLKSLSDQNWLIIKTALIKISKKFKK